MIDFSLKRRSAPRMIVPWSLAILLAAGLAGAGSNAASADGAAIGSLTATRACPALQSIRKASVIGTLSIVFSLSTQTSRSAS